MLQLLWLLLWCTLPATTRSADEIVLLNTGVRCTTTQQCIDYFTEQKCKFLAYYCLGSACRVEPSLPCRTGGDATCNSRNHQCDIQTCNNDTACGKGLCDGEEQCVAGRCVFRYTGSGSGVPCRVEEATKQRVLPDTHILTTPAPTASPTSAPTVPTTAPPLPPINVQLWVVILIGVVIGAALFVAIIAMVSRSKVPINIVNYEDTGGATVIY